MREQKFYLRTNSKCFAIKIDITPTKLLSHLPDRQSIAFADFLHHPLDMIERIWFVIELNKGIFVADDFPQMVQVFCFFRIRLVVCSSKERKSSFPRGRPVRSWRHIDSRSSSGISVENNSCQLSTIPEWDPNQYIVFTLQIGFGTAPFILFGPFNKTGPDRKKIRF